VDAGEEVFAVVIRTNRILRASKLYISYQNLCLSKVLCEFGFVYYTLPLFEYITQVKKIFPTESPETGLSVMHSI